MGSVSSPIPTLYCSQAHSVLLHNWLHNYNDSAFSVGRSSKMGLATASHFVIKILRNE